MFGFLRKKTEKIVAPMRGRVIEIENIPDPTFAEEMLGPCIAIEPTDGTVYAPCSGTVDMIFETKHALTMTTDKGVEILLHLGIGTVALGGKPFKVFIAAGDEVRSGDKIMEMDLSIIGESDCSIISPLVICNSDDMSAVTKVVESGDVEAGQVIMEIEP